MRLAVLVLLVFFSLPALAHPQSLPSISLNFSWDAPTQYSDGTPVGPGDLAGYLLCLSETPIDDVSPCPGVVEPVSDGDATSASVSFEPPAPFFTLYFRIRAVDVAGIESPWSGQRARPFGVSMPPPLDGAFPGAPSNFQVQ